MTELQKLGGWLPRNTRRPGYKDVVQNLLDHFRILEYSVNKMCMKHQCGNTDRRKLKFSEENTSLRICQP